MSHYISSPLATQICLSAGLLGQLLDGAPISFWGERDEVIPTVESIGEAAHRVSSDLSRHVADLRRAPTPVSVTGIAAALRSFAETMEYHGIQCFVVVTSGVVHSYTRFDIQALGLLCDFEVGVSRRTDRAGRTLIH